MNNLKNSLFKSDIYIVIIVSFLLLFLNRYNNHGDFLFYKQLYTNFEFLNIKNLILIFFAISDNNFYYNAEPLFLIFYKLVSKLINYNLYNFLTTVIFVIVYIKFIKLYKPNKLLFILILISSYYLWSLVLASEKNKLALIFFFMSLIYLNKFYIFAIFFYLTTLFHSSYMLYYFVIFFYLFLINFEQTKKKFFELKKYKILIIIIPILFNITFLSGKFFGYNEHSQRLANTQDVKYQIENRSNSILNKMSDSFIYKMEIEETKISKYIKYFLSYNKSIELFKISIEIPYNGITYKDKPISIIINSIIFIKLLFFYLILFLITNNFKVNLTHFTFVFLIASFIGLIRFPIILFILALILILQNIDNFNKLSYRVALSLLCIFSSYKTIELILNLIKHGNIY